MNSHSPISSYGGVESNEGTPDTTLTAFSPEEVRPSRIPPNQSDRLPSVVTQHDPFVSTSARPLSATASTFQPLAFRAGPSSGSLGSAADRHDVQYMVQPAHQMSPGGTNITQFGTFTTDTGATRCMKVKAIYDYGMDPLPFVNATLQRLQKYTKFNSIHNRVQSCGGVVWIRLSNIEEAMKTYTAIKMEHSELSIEYTSANSMAKAVSPKNEVHSSHEGQITLVATYPPQAQMNKKRFEETLINWLEVDNHKLCAWQKLSATQAGTFRLVAEYYDSAFAAKAVERSKGDRVKDYCSSRLCEVSVQVHHPDLAVSSRVAPPAPEKTPTRRSAAQSDLSSDFDRMSISNTLPQSFPRCTDPSTSEFSYPQVTTGATFALTGPVMMGHPYVSALGGPYQHYPNATQPQSHAANYSFNSMAVHPYSYDSLDQRALAQFGPRQHSFDLMHGYHGSNNAFNSRELTYYGRANGRRQNAVKVPNHLQGRSTNSAGSHHNHVDIARIQGGIDVRTTVMLRNIPNKLDQRELKEVIDQSSYGKYDFMYLRIDFSNNCNVGYAFINFTDPLDIVNFVRARANQKWHRFKSDKVAEVSYATIQGKDCLVQKFRNSSVMLEPPHYRPKLYYTEYDPNGRVGQEEPFPESDNASKLKRSCENAEHVGLFAPSAGQHLRDEQRRRRSQYDRGTSLAEREDFLDYEEDYPPYGLLPY